MDTPVPARRWRQGRWLVVLLAIGMVMMGTGWLIAAELERYMVNGRRSGYTYLAEENRRLHGRLKYSF